jgi:glycosyltransferase involved in cell wall biosynthesis
MTRVLIVGFAPLPVERLPMSGPSLRTWHLVSAILGAGHEVCLIANRGHDVYPADLPPITSQRNGALTYHNVADEQWHTPAALISLVTAFAPTCVVGITAAGSAASVPLASLLPLWADLYGSLMAEAQMKAQVFNDDSYLAHFWRIELAALQRADRFSTVSARQRWALIGELGLVGRLNRWTSGYEFATTMPIAVETTPFVPQAPLLRGRVVPEGAFVILYSGGYNTWCDVDGLFAALEGVMHRHLHVHFVSTGGKIEGHDPHTFARFTSMVSASPHASRYHLQGWVPAADLPAYYAESDVAVNADKPSYEAMLGSRTRALDWLRAGLPCVLSDLPELAAEFRAAGVALTYRAGDVEDLSACLERCVAHPDLLRTMRKKAPALLHQYSYAATTAGLLRWVAEPSHAPDFMRNPPQLSRPADDALTSAALSRLVLIAMWGHVQRIARRLSVPEGMLARVGRLGARWLGIDRPPLAVEFVSHTLPVIMYAGGHHTGEVVLKNVGARTWPVAAGRTAPLNLSYHWRTAAGVLIEKEGVRSALPHRVPPDAAVTVTATILAPTTPGQYLLELDLVQEGVTWLSECGSPSLYLHVDVGGSPP